MAEIPSPPLERPASEIDYKPMSGLAVAAMVVTGIYILAIAIIASFALYYRKPTLSWSWLFLAGLGLALTIAARIQIRRSEGTREGMKLTTISWWLSVLGGAAFAAYLVASSLALRKQSEDEAQRFFTLLKKNDPL